MKLTSLILFVCLFASLFPLASQSVSLRYNLKKGDMFLMNQQSSQDIHQEIQGMSNDMQMFFGGKTSFTVYDIQEDVYCMKIAYETLQFKLTSMMFNLDFDSEKPGDVQNPVNKALGAIVGAEFDVLMNDKGRILKVSGFEKIFRSMVDSLNGDQNMAEQVSASLEQQFGNESMKSSLEMMTAIFPDKEVRVGDSWNILTAQAGGMKLSSNHTITLNSITDGKWNLTGTSVLSTSEGALSEANGMTQRFNLNGTSDFQLILDANTGWVIENSISQNIDGSVTLEGGQLPAPMEVPMKIKSATKVTNN